MRLIFTSGSREGQSLDFDGRLTIGRDDDNDLQLPTRRSRGTTRDRAGDGGSAVLRDLNSRNGTFVDGVRLSGRGSCRRRAAATRRAQLRVDAEARRRRRAARSEPRAQVAPMLIAGAVAAGLSCCGARPARAAGPGRGQPALGSRSTGASTRHMSPAGDDAAVAQSRPRRRDDGQLPLRPRRAWIARRFPQSHALRRQLDARVAFLEAQLVALHDVRLPRTATPRRAGALTQRELSAALPGFVASGRCARPGTGSWSGGWRPRWATPPGFACGCSPRRQGRRPARRRCCSARS